MRKSLLGIVLAASLTPMGVVHADAASVARDLSNNVPVETIISNAQAAGESLTAVLGNIISADASKGYDAFAAAVAAAPEQSDRLFTTASSKGLDKGRLTRVGMAAAPTARARALIAKAAKRAGVPDSDIRAAIAQADSQQQENSLSQGTNAVVLGGAGAGGGGGFGLSLEDLEDLLANSQS